MGAAHSNAERKREIRLQFQVSTDFDIEEVIEAAELAGKKILEIYSSDVETWGVQSKSDQSPLTKADLEANAIICKALARMAPHVPIISEENKQMSYETREGYQYCWLVDPLDGTKEFLKRNGQFTVNIALIQEESPVLGVVHVPCQGTTYWALQGQGAYKRTNGVDKKIRCAEFDMKDPNLIFVTSGSHKDTVTPEFIELFDKPICKPLGSSLKLVMVAEGEAHICPRFGPTCEWDTAAADAIVREAGGRVLQAGKCSGSGEAFEDWKEVLPKEQLLVYNKEDLLNPFFVTMGTVLTPSGSFLRNVFSQK